MDNIDEIMVLIAKQKHIRDHHYTQRREQHAASDKRTKKIIDAKTRPIEPVVPLEMKPFDKSALSAYDPEAVNAKLQADLKEKIEELKSKQPSKEPAPSAKAEKSKKNDGLLVETKAQDADAPNKYFNK
jgi:hypothetical protein